jgi:hypothetical protein
LPLTENRTPISRPPNLYGTELPRLHVSGEHIAYLIRLEEQTYQEITRFNCFFGFFLGLLLCPEAKAVFLRIFDGLSHTIVLVAIAAGEKDRFRKA